MQRRPAPAIWAAWGLVLVGGLLVLAAAVTTLNDPCVGRGDLPLTAACVTSTRGGLAFRLAVGGTVAAVAGLFTATLLTVRRVGRRRANDGSIR